MFSAVHITACFNRCRSTVSSNVYISWWGWFADKTAKNYN